MGAKISEFDPLVPTPAAGDLVPLVDISDPTQAPSGSTKRTTIQLIADFVTSSASNLLVIANYIIASVPVLQAIADYIASLFQTEHGEYYTSDFDSIQDAIDAAEDAGGGKVIIPAGTHYIAVGLTLPSSVDLEGMGKYNTVLKPSASMTSMLTINGYWGRVSNIYFFNVSAYATNAVEFADGSRWNTLENTKQKYFTNGIYGSGGMEVKILGGHSDSNTIGINVVDKFYNSAILGWYSEAENGILLTATGGVQPEGVSISNCKILPNETSGSTRYAVRIEAGLSIDIGDCMLDQIGNTGGVMLASDPYDVAYIQIHDNWIGGNTLIASASGIALFCSAAHRINNVSISDNHIFSNSYYGIRLEYVTSGVSYDITIIGNKFYNNTTGDLLVYKAANVKVIANTFTHATYDINEVDNDSNVVAMFNTMPHVQQGSTASTYKYNFGAGGDI